MAITTSGGSGTGTGQFSNASPFLRTETITLFTTPNTTNATFIVTWFATEEQGNSGRAMFIAPTLATGVAATGGVIKVGPNTAVTILVTKTLNSGTVVDYRWAYNYIGIVVT